MTIKKIPVQSCSGIACFREDGTRIFMILKMRYDGLRKIQTAFIPGTNLAQTKKILRYHNNHKNLCSISYNGKEFYPTFELNSCLTN